MLVSSPRIVASLRGIARVLSSNPADRDDLLQEMLIHLWQSELENPGQTESWYLQNCKFHGLDYLKRGRSVDSKHRAGCVLVSMDREVSDTATPIFEPADDRDFRDQLSATDALSLLRRRLTAGQQALLDAFASGASVAEVSEALGCSHQYVSKQRKKIALALAGVLA
jgi:DNA-directed RNA polymerase specialized sigma24 family protein